MLNKRVNRNLKLKNLAFTSIMRERKQTKHNLHFERKSALNVISKVGHEQFEYLA
jgi:hypothetical protein